MKHLIYLAVLASCIVAHAHDNILDPVEKKAEICQQYEEIKSILSCKGEDCDSLHEDDVPLFFEIGIIKYCSSNCTINQEPEECNHERKACMLTIAIMLSNRICSPFPAEIKQLDLGNYLF